MMTQPWQQALQTLPIESVDNCVLCDGIGKNDARFYSLLMLVDPYKVQRCPNCGLRWLSPRPSQEGYSRLYSKDFYFGGSGASPADYAAVVAERVSYFRKRIQRFAKMVGTRSSLSILDYGAATGEFVAVARGEGHLCEGIELSGDARRQAKSQLGVDLRSPDELAAWRPELFDVLHMNHVLEHTPDPAQHIQWCARMLKSGGMLVIEVPQQFDNDLDRVRRLIKLGGRQKRFDAYSLHHTYFFNAETLKFLLEQNGFEVIRLKTFNSDKTPLLPLRLNNLVLYGLLSMADKLHKGGNIIEVFAKRKVGDEST